MDTVHHGEVRGFSIPDAMNQIQGIEQQAMQMGANDYEPSAFASIKKAVTAREVSPEEAVKQARQVLDSKNAYH